MPESLNNSKNPIENSFEQWSKYVPNTTSFNINMKHLGNVKGKNVIDFECRNGAFLKSCVENGASRVVGLDKSPFMIRLAKETNPESSETCSFRVQDCSKSFIMGNNFDFACSNYSLQNCSTYDQFETYLTNMYNSLKTGGMAIISLPRMAKSEQEQEKCAAEFGFVLPLDDNNSGQERLQWTLDFLVPDIEKGEGFLNETFFTALETGWSDKLLLRTMYKIGFREVELLNPKVFVTRKNDKKELISACCLLAVGKK